MQFSDSFIDEVAAILKDLLKEADDRKPFAAILYVVNKHEEIINDGVEVARDINTEFQTSNTNAHAERNVVNLAANTLFDALQLPIDQRREFCLFVNTRPCPKCTTALVDAQIFNVYFFYDNDYKRDISEAIIKAKEASLVDLGIDRLFVFQEVPSVWKTEFQLLLAQQRK